MSHEPPFESVCSVRYIYQPEHTAAWSKMHLVSDQGYSVSDTLRLHERERMIPIARAIHQLFSCSVPSLYSRTASRQESSLCFYFVILSYALPVDFLLQCVVFCNRYVNQHGWRRPWDGMDGEEFAEWARNMKCIAATRYERPENVVRLL